jgi:hypothetical protein
LCASAPGLNHALDSVSVERSSLAGRSRAVREF